MSQQSKAFIKELNKAVPDKPKPVSKIAKVPLITTKDGTHPIKLRANLTSILSYYDDKLAGNFRYNENTHLVEVVEDRKLHNGVMLKAGKMDDDRVSQVTSYIATTYKLDFNDDLVGKEITVVSRANSYNPIKIMLETALGKPETDPFPIIQKYINIEETEYNRIAFDLFFRGAIGRVLDEGCKFDYCLDLTGEQGTGKTTFLREMFNPYYAEVADFSKKDELAKMAESWLVDDDELVATRKSSFPEVKQTITMQELNYRPPYGKGLKRQKIDFVFSRTTNDFQHLGDATGDRRFLPVRVQKRRPDQPEKMTDNDRLTIWGNYYRAYKENRVLYYQETSKEGQIIAEEREKYRTPDEELERLEWYLDTWIPEDFYSDNTLPYQRKNYYFDLEQYGKAYKTDSDKKNKVEWKGTQPRDRVTIPLVMDELFYNIPASQQKRVKTKSREFLNRNPKWEFKNSVRTGGRVGKGWTAVSK